MHYTYLVIILDVALALLSLFLYIRWQSARRTNRLKDKQIIEMRRHMRRIVDGATVAMGLSDEVVLDALRKGVKLDVQTVLRMMHLSQELANQPDVAYDDITSDDAVSAEGDQGATLPPFGDSTGSEQPAPVEQSRIMQAAAKMRQGDRRNSSFRPTPSNGDRSTQPDEPRSEPKPKPQNEAFWPDPEQ